MTRRILSLAVALIASILGYFALWTGGMKLAFAASSFSSYRPDGAAIDFGALALVLVGLILLAIAALTVALSSLGVIVVGAVHLLVGLISIVSPARLLEVRPITYELFNQLVGGQEALNYGFFTSVPTGVGATIGVALLIAGIMARGRSGAANPIWRVVSPILAVVLGIGGLLLVLMQGMVVYTNQLQQGRWDANPTVIGLLLCGLLLVAAVVATVRWSSAGAFVLGGVLTVYGVIALFQPSALSQALMPVSREFSLGVLLWSSNGSFALIGIVLLAVGFGVRVRGRRRSLTVRTAGEAPAVA